MSPFPQRPLVRALCRLCIVLAFAGSLEGYGPFKQRSDTLDWRVLKTPHFDIYFYPEEEGLARRAALLAEQALRHNAHALDYYPKARQPLFLFQNHLQFQQTNISKEVIGPGTGGFTEAFKNRMVLPTNQSDRWLEVVITHELAHAIQFNVLYGEGTRSFQVFKNYVIPLWFMEGSAEWCARNWDSYADMVLRDAVLNERLPDLEAMDGFSHLDEVYVAYKAGQSAVQYLADNYGPGSVAKMLRKYKAQISTGQIIKDITGQSLAAFNRAWKSGLRQKYWLQARGKKSAASLGMALTWDDHRNLTLNNGATWSPDGSRLAFVTTRMQREEIWTMAADGKDARPLFKGPFEEVGRSGAYGVSGNRLSWSPDGSQLAFVLVEDNAKHLVLGDVTSGRWRRIETAWREIAAPAFSPDGKRIAFSAARNGISQIQILDLASGSVTPGTSETARSLVTDPAWSPDGAWLAYSAEEAGRNQVFVCRPGGAEHRRVSPPEADCLMPAFSVDGERVFFITDEGGAYNLAWARPDGTGYERLSDVVTGVFQPRPSPDGRWLSLVAYEDGCQNIYRLQAPGYKAPPPSLELQKLINPYRFAVAPQTQAPSNAPGETTRARVETAASELKPPALSAELPPPGETEDVPSELRAAELPIQPYRPRLSPDLFFVLLGYDSQNGLVGGGYLSASDMASDHNLVFYANFVPGYHSVLQGDYVFERGAGDWGLSLFYRNTHALLSGINPQTVASTFLDQDYGVQLYYARPLSKFTQLSVQLGARKLLRELNGQAALDPTVAGSLGDSIINATGFSLVRDTLTYKNYDVYGGYRVGYNFSYAERLLGGTRNFVLHQGEWRLALPLSFVDRDAVLMLRAVALDQSGLDRQLFHFGGAQVRGLSYNEELGQRFAYASFQYRHPYLSDFQRSLWPLDFLLIKDIAAVAFYDLGVVQNEWNDVRPERIRGGYGVGLRMYSFLFQKAFLLWAFDVAQRTDRPGGTYYYFTLGQIF